MATLNYVVGSRNKHKILLINDSLINIDKRTSRKGDVDSFICGTFYEDIIGTYLYDNEEFISEEEKLIHQMKIEYELSIEDVAILSSKIESFKFKNKLEIEPIFSDNVHKLEPRILEKNILTKNKKLEKYLHQLAKLEEYYTYLRIIDSYYNSKAKILSKKSFIKYN